MARSREGDERERRVDEPRERRERDDEDRRRSSHRRSSSDRDRDELRYDDRSRHHRDHRMHERDSREPDEREHRSEKRRRPNQRSRKDSTSPDSPRRSGERRKRVSDSVGTADPKSAIIDLTKEDVEQALDPKWWEEWVHSQKVVDQEQRMAGWSYDPNSKFYFDRNGVWFDPQTQRYFDTKTNMYHDITTGASYSANPEGEASEKKDATADADAGKKSKKKSKRKRKIESDPVDIVICDGGALAVGVDGITVGRSSLSGFRAKGRGVSRLHCEIFYRRGKFQLKDVSTNGTILNDAILKSEERDLSIGDVVRVGESLFKLVSMRSSHSGKDEPELVFETWRERNFAGNSTDDFEEIPVKDFSTFKNEVFSVARRSKILGEEYVDRAAERRLNCEPGEPITRDVRKQDEIPESNIGRKMLKSLGWTGQGLGRNANGIREPINPTANLFKRGLE